MVFSDVCARLLVRVKAALYTIELHSVYRSKASVLIRSMSSDEAMVARLRHFFGDFIGWNFGLVLLSTRRRNNRKIMQIQLALIDSFNFNIVAVILE